MARSAGEQPGRRPSGDRGSSSPALVFKDAGAGARAERATGAGGAGPSLHKSKDVPRFAPNFSVYLLPPETVCLYSEDRKFFLHGELYCALALAIGDGKRSFREIVGPLEQRFPSDKIQEALKRLIDRRYRFVAASRTRALPLTSDGAAYWASLGAAAGGCGRKICANARVRIQSIDVQGGKELGAALGALGVRVVKGTAELTVTLVNDYLEGKLAELNRQHLSDGTPWLLVQPSGIFPLVGPVLRPGDGACWVCLAERMARNREVKALLDRRQARRVAVSPLARQPFGQSAHPAGGGRDRQSDRHRLPHRVARSHCQPRPDGLDASSSISSRPARNVRLAASKKLRDPRRAPVPIELRRPATSWS